MSFEESQEYIAKSGLDIAWNDGDIFIDEREMTRTIGNVLKWADERMIERVCNWLKGNLPYSSKPPYQLIEDLRKAMEE